MGRYEEHKKLYENNEELNRKLSDSSLHRLILVLYKINNSNYYSYRYSPNLWVNFKEIKSAGLYLNNYSRLFRLLHSNAQNQVIIKNNWNAYSCDNIIKQITTVPAHNNVH